jgi:hypothetical protein
MTVFREKELAMTVDQRSTKERRGGALAPREWPLTSFTLSELGTSWEI